MEKEQKYYYGNPISDYGLENGRVDYGTLAKAFDAVLNNDIMDLTYDIGYWEQVSGIIDNTDEIEELEEKRDELEEENENNPSQILENEINKINDEIEELEREQDDDQEPKWYHKHHRFASLLVVPVYKEISQPWLSQRPLFLFPHQAQ